MTSVLCNRRAVQPSLPWIFILAAAIALAVAGVAPALAAEPASGKSGPLLSAATETPTTAWLPKPVVEIAEANAATPRAMKPYTEPIPGTDVKFDMLPIPGGKFLMGSPKGEKGHQADEGPTHEVAIEPFWMEKHEITWDEYELWGLGLDIQRRKMKNIASTERDVLVDAVARPTKPYADMTFGMGKEGYPAVCMTQLAAKMYCKWLSAKTGRYYRLPTEAEWEYACRAGTSTAYSFGSDPKKLGDYAWFYGNSEEKYHKVGQKKPNAWGLCDMHGNVAEWTLDQYTADGYPKFAGKKADNPLVAASTEYGRVVRGGSWDDDAEKCRSAARTASTKDWKKQDPQIPQSIWYLTDANFVGFRVVRPLRVPTPAEAKRYDLDDNQLQQLKDYKEAQAGKE
ncbi:MAG: formylglycine-generating enzyme family protein [Thermoguttaceae bacterium]|jgi:formylglycine-generating enzyme required for sulfatase activity